MTTLLARLFGQKSASSAKQKDELRQKDRKRESERENTRQQPPQRGQNQMLPLPRTSSAAVPSFQSLSPWNGSNANSPISIGNLVHAHPEPSYARGGEVETLRTLTNFQKVGMLGMETEYYWRSQIRQFDRTKIERAGEGTFGRVFLVRHRFNQRYFALKVMKKTTIIKLKQVSHVHNERNILAAVDSPFIVRLSVMFLSPSPRGFP